MLYTVHVQPIYQMSETLQNSISEMFIIKSVYFDFQYCLFGTQVRNMN